MTRGCLVWVTGLGVFSAGCGGDGELDPLDAAVVDRIMRADGDGIGHRTGVLVSSTADAECCQEAAVFSACAFFEYRFVQANGRLYVELPGPSFGFFGAMDRDGSFETGMIVREPVLGPDMGLLARIDGTLEDHAAGVYVDAVLTTHINIDAAPFMGFAPEPLDCRELVPLQGWLTR